MLNPTFPQDEVTKLVKQRIDGIKAAKDQAEGVIGTYFSSYLYGGHPYGRPTGGDEKSLAAITRDDVAQVLPDVLRAVERDHGRRRRFRLCGDGAAGSRKSSARGRPGPRPRSACPRSRPSAGKRLLLVDKPDSTQTFFIIGNTGINRMDPDRVYINVVNTLLGGRFTSMLNTELRIKTGLSYGRARASASARCAGRSPSRPSRRTRRPKAPSTSRSGCSSRCTRRA